MGKSRMKILTLICILAKYSSGTHLNVDMEHLGVLLNKAILQYLPGCHIVFLTTAARSPLFSSIHRGISVGVVIESGPEIFKEMWGESTTTCRGLILHVHDNDNSTTLALRLLEEAGLWKLPETLVLVIGQGNELKTILLHASLRNTVHAIYLALNKLLPKGSLYSMRFQKRTEKGNLMEHSICVYRRCLYCNGGESDITLVSVLNPQNVPARLNFFNSDEIQNLHGHVFKVVTVPHFPFMDYVINSYEPGSTVIPKDAMDTRLINTFSKKLNFRYEMRGEPNRTWGHLLKNGVFTGMMGQLQREEADFTTVAAPTPERLAVMNFVTGYPSDHLTVISHKPSLLPQHLALIRPFTAMVWTGVFLCAVIHALTMWLLQRIFQWLFQGSSVPLDKMVMYSWGALLEQPPSDPSVSVSGQMLVGWWLVFCLIVSTGFRSSLIAHLTVQGKTQPPKTMRDLVKADKWEWSTEPWLKKGVPIQYFSTHPDPVVQEIYAKMQWLELEKAVQKVMKGRFSMIIYENYIAPIIATRYTDLRGRTPFYISKETFPVMASVGWSFRKGLPIYRRINELMHSLRDAGIIAQWTQEVMANRVRAEKGDKKIESFDVLNEIQKEYASGIPLGVGHLQGAFILFSFGSVVGLLSFVMEYFFA